MTPVSLSALTSLPSQKIPVNPRIIENPLQTRRFAWRRSYPLTAILNTENKKSPGTPELFAFNPSNSFRKKYLPINHLE
jgi:hypothetical protein